MKRVLHFALLIAPLLLAPLAYALEHGQVGSPLGDAQPPVDQSTGDDTILPFDAGPEACTNTFVDACSGSGSNGCAGFGGGAGSGGQGGGATIPLFASGTTTVTISNGGLFVGNGGTGGNGADGQDGTEGDAGASGLTLTCSMTSACVLCSDASLAGGPGGSGGNGGAGGTGGGGAGGPGYFYATVGGAIVNPGTATVTQFLGKPGIPGTPNGVVGVQAPHP